MTVLKTVKNEDGTQAELEVISPSYAAQLLEGNKNNRRLNPHLVAYYQRQIESGAWQVNGDSIKLDDHGNLLDGQHRLTAIVKAGKAIKTWVVRGLSSEAFKTIDCGRPRSPADFLRVDGKVGNLIALAAAAKAAMKFDKKTGAFSKSNNRLSPGELIAWLDKHKGMEQSVEFATTLKAVTSQSIGAACHYIFSVVDPVKAQQFFEALATGARLSKSNPALTVRNRLMTIRAERRGGGTYQLMIVAYLVQAFNAYRAGKPLSNSVYTLGNDIILDDFAGSMR